MRVISEVEEEGEGTRPVEKARIDRMTRAAEGRWEGGEQELMRVAWQGFKGVGAALKRGKGRRAVPEWSVRGEAWLMAVCDAR